MRLLIPVAAALLSFWGNSASSSVSNVPINYSEMNGSGRFRLIFELLFLSGDGQSLLGNGFNSTPQGIDEFEWHDLPSQLAVVTAMGPLLDPKDPSTATIKLDFKVKLENYDFSSGMYTMAVPSSLDPVQGDGMSDMFLQLKYDFTNVISMGTDADYYQYIQTLNANERPASLWRNKFAKPLIPFGFYGGLSFAQFMMSPEDAAALHGATSDGFLDFSGICVFSVEKMEFTSKFGCTVFQGELVAGQTHVKFSPFPEALELTK